jgi:hypothetical protein
MLGRNGKMKERKPGLLVREFKARCQWLTPVILATQEAEITRIVL